MGQSAEDPLSLFSPPVREWFAAAFAAPTRAQREAWPAIARGEHVLLCAPTGSGKTLAAFLWAIDTLSRESDAGRRPAESEDAIPAAGRAAPPPAEAGSEPSTTGPTAAGEARPAPQSDSAGATRDPAAPSGRTHLLYISPMKALSYDIERNLRVPLRGIGAQLQVAIRTGDTPQRERAAMARRPPDILITTPESLYLLLTSRAREILAGVRSVIVDEVHAVASTKRGAHLALSLERLDALISEHGRPAGAQRIGLSATQTPLEEVARYLVGPQRLCTIVDATDPHGVGRSLQLSIEVPAESMDRPAAPEQSTLQPVPGGESLGHSIWPAIYPRLLELVREHSSSIVFVNSRRTAERIAMRLNELADGQEVARAHHGSLSSEERALVEELLKSGSLPCLVATSSLELGIDMGAVDLVIQISSPKSVASGLQRIGRAGHSVGEPSKGVIFPRYRGDLLECAVLARAMREGAIEPTVVPRNPLDVLAQQIVASAAAEGEISVAELHRRARATHTYGDLSLTQLENVLDMLDGRYPSSEFAELRPRIVWDRLRGVIEPRRGAQRLAVLNAGTIPDRGLYMVTLPDGRRVGELDEEMVYEARPGQAFLLGASAWRIEEIGRDRVIVTPAPGAPGAVPFWKGDGLGRSRELGEAIGAFSRWAAGKPAERLERDYDLGPSAAGSLLELLAEQRAATGAIPSDRTIVVERFRDEIGDWRLCVLSPYGRRIHAAWALALSASVGRRLGLQPDVIASDDGIVMHLPDSEQPPGAEIAMIEPDEVEDLLLAQLSASALFGARFRESAARALLIPRAVPGRRTPLWQQRLKAQALLGVAERYSQFPIILETYRECLRDVLDLPGLRDILGRLQRRQITVVEVETQRASPFAASLLFDFLAAYMYEGDAPSAERRAAALSLDRDLLGELLGQEELRELIDPDALAEVEADLQCLSARAAARDPEEVHDMLRRLGDLSEAEIAERAAAGLDARAALRQLRRRRRALPLRIGGQERFVDAADAGLYRDALGAVPPPGLPDAFLADVPDALPRLLRRYAATRGPFTTEAACARFGLGRGVLEPALAELERAGDLVRGELRPGGPAGRREWCDAEVLRRLRRASLAALRKEIEPVDSRAFAAFQAAWHGIDAHPGGGAGVERLRGVLASLQGIALTPSTWEHDVLPRRLGAYSPAWLEELCVSGEVVWVGAGAAGRAEGRVALYFREDMPAIGPPSGSSPQAAGGRPVGAGGQAPASVPLPPLGSSPQADRDDGSASARDGGPAAPPVQDGALQGAIMARLEQGACFFADLLAELDAPSAAELQEALWDLAFAGLITNDSFAVLRRSARGGRAATARSIAARGGSRGHAARRFAGRRAAGAAAVLPGRFSPTAPLFAGKGAADPVARRRTIAELLLERYGLLTRELVRSEGVQGGFAALYEALSQLEVLGAARRGYFVEGLGGAQFALPGAVEQLRALRLDGERDGGALVLAATDPAQPYGAALPWPAAARRQSDGPARGRGPARLPGAYVVLVDWLPVLYVERGGRGLITLEATGAPEDGLRAALAALAAAAGSGMVGARLAIERIDGEPVLGSPLEQVLLDLGFRAGHRGLIMRASG